MSHTKKLTMTALVAAVTSISSSLFFIPIGFAKIFPIQHLVNLLSAVLLGPAYAVMQAFLSSTIRNILGTGSVFAYPGSMIGAFLAAILYSKTKQIGLSAIGEVIGTGILGAIATYPVAVLLLGKEATLFGLIPAFTISSITGALMGYGLIKILIRKRVVLPIGQKIR